MRIPTSVCSNYIGAFGHNQFTTRAVEKDPSSHRAPLLAWRYGSDEALTDLKSKKEPQSTKIVAMHRVRWNVNKGRERWLYSGGAAGIVRRQENKWSDVDICLAMKR
ncbi:hypothetical protein OIU74_002627 [Salix koriyanagi]|uniref:Uncharacterized protein n=1 Tax=Salix koriyanagi TaxID=2511006 RepID=A0A9Q0X406_9ROSI|nr:hypothetical protein OIU74_002627 [Salix koriyanagi]